MRLITLEHTGQQMSSVVFFFILVATPRPALAYLDPGSGSMLLQLLLGGIAGIAVLLRIFWDKLQTNLSRLLLRKPRRDAS